jgi:hypothetical protein
MPVLALPQDVVVVPRSVYLGSRPFLTEFALVDFAGPLRLASERVTPGRPQTSRCRPTRRRRAESRHAVSERCSWDADRRLDR